MKTLQNNLNMPKNCLNLMKHYIHLDRAADPHHSELASFKFVTRTVKHPAKTNQGQTKFWKRKQESKLLDNVPKRQSLETGYTTFYAEVGFKVEFLKTKVRAKYRRKEMQVRNRSKDKLLKRESVFLWNKTEILKLWLMMKNIYACKTTCETAQCHVKRTMPFMKKDCITYSQMQYVGLFL